MELALEMRGSFICAYVGSYLLRANLNARFWCRALKHFRESVQKNLVLFGEYPNDLKWKGQFRHTWSMSETSGKFFLLLDSYQRGPAAHGDAPRITMMDLISGSARPRGTFEVLLWRSLMPPYYSYISSCKFVQHKNTTAVRKKRSAPPSA